MLLLQSSLCVCYSLVHPLNRHGRWLLELFVLWSTPLLPVLFNRGPVTEYDLLLQRYSPSVCALVFEKKQSKGVYQRVFECNACLFSEVSLFTQSAQAGVYSNKLFFGEQRAYAFLGLLIFTLYISEHKSGFNDDTKREGRDELAFWWC